MAEGLPGCLTLASAASGHGWGGQRGLRALEMDEEPEGGGSRTGAALWLVPGGARAHAPSAAGISVLPGDCAWILNPPWSKAAGEEQLQGCAACRDVVRRWILGQGRVIGLC